MDIEDLAKELGAYVSLRHSLGDKDCHFEDALLGHRRQAVQNFLDDEDEETWVGRIELLDKLAESKAIPLIDERSLRSVLSELRTRDDRRRKELRDIDLANLAKGIGA